jgi:hypothetical protein
VLVGTLYPLAARGGDRRPRSRSAPPFFNAHLRAADGARCCCGAVRPAAGLEARRLYISVGEPQPDGSLGMRLFYKPFILLIWIGTVIMAVGAGIAMTDRRFRVGAPVRSRRTRDDAMPAPAE